MRIQLSCAPLCLNSTTQPSNELYGVPGLRRWWYVVPIRRSAAELSIASISLASLERYRPCREKSISVRLSASHPHQPASIVSTRILEHGSFAKALEITAGCLQLLFILFCSISLVPSDVESLFLLSQTALIALIGPRYCIVERPSNLQMNNKEIRHLSDDSKYCPELLHVAMRETQSRARHVLIHHD